MIGFYGGMAMHDASRIVALLRDPAAFGDPRVTAQADILADAIAQSLADETVARAEAKAAGDTRHALRDSNYRSAAGHLQTMIGVYREIRHGGNTALRPMLLGAYNAAVESVNVGR